MRDKLKSCPFCGGEAKIIEVKDNPPETIAIQCKSGCGVSVHNKWMEENVLIERWNTRAERTCKAEQDYDAMDDGIPDCRIWKCSCGESFPFWRGLNPCFCPNCGAKVIDDEG